MSELEPGTGVGAKALEQWRRKLAFLLEQEPIVSSAEQKFEIRERIREARERIDALSCEGAVLDTVPPPARQLPAVAAPQIVPSRTPRPRSSLWMAPRPGWAERFWRWLGVLVSSAPVDDPGTSEAAVRTAQSVRAEEAVPGAGRVAVRSAAGARPVALEPWHTTRQRDRCRSVAWHPDGGLLAVASGAVIQIWEPGTGREIRILQGHEGPVNAVAWSREGFIASASDDRTVRLWGTDSGRELRALKCTGKVLSAALSPDGQTLAGGLEDGKIVIWRVPSGQQVQIIQGHQSAVRSLAMSPDGRSLASGSDDRTLRLWKMNSGKPILKLLGLPDRVKSVAFSPDGQILAGGCGDGSILLWQTGSGKLLFEVGKHDLAVFSLAFSPDGQTLASGSFDHDIGLWRRGSPLRYRSATLSGHKRTVLSVSFSPDGRTLASASDDTTVRLWDVRALASASDDTTVRLWDVASEQLARSLQREPIVIHRVAFNQDGMSLATVSEDGTCHFWQIPSGEQIRLLRSSSRARGTAISPDGKRVASADYKTIRLLQTDTGREEHTLRGHTSSITDLVFSPDGQTVASVSSDDTIRLWQVETGLATRVIQSKAGGLGLLCVAFSPDGRILACGSRSKVQLWCTDSGMPASSLKGHREKVSHVAFSPDGWTLASSDGESVRRWHLESGQEILCLLGHRFSCLAFSPDGHTLATADGLNVRLWNPTSGRQVGLLQGNWDEVLSLTYSPDGRLLAISSRDGTVRLWDLAAGRCAIALLPLPAGWVTFAPDGRYKYGGFPAGSFWHVAGLQRFEIGDLDTQVPGLRLPDGASFFDLPTWPPEEDADQD